MRILIVDDSPLACKGLKAMLESEGAEQVVICDDPMFAKRLLQKNDFDLVFSDWEMPGLTGLELLNFARSELGLTKEELPFVLVTSHGSQSHIEEGVRAGVSHFIHKPFTTEDCRKVLKVFMKPGNGATSRLRGTGIARKDAKLLIVDDSKMILTMLQQMLSNLGFVHVEECLDGESASARLQESAFDLVICDIEMPGATGIEVLKELREREGGEKRTPFIIASSVNEREMIVDAARHGVTDYLLKPFTEDLVDEKIKKLFRDPE